MMATSPHVMLHVQCVAIVVLLAPLGAPQVADLIQGTIDNGDGFIGPYGVAAAAGEFVHS